MKITRHIDNIALCLCLPNRFSSKKGKTLGWTAAIFAAIATGFMSPITSFIWVKCRKVKKFQKNSESFCVPKIVETKSTIIQPKGYFWEEDESSEIFDIVPVGPTNSESKGDTFDWGEEEIFDFGLKAPNNLVKSIEAILKEQQSFEDQEAYLKAQKIPKYADPIQVNLQNVGDKAYILTERSIQLYIRVEPSPATIKVVCINQQPKKSRQSVRTINWNV